MSILAARPTTAPSSAFGQSVKARRAPRGCPVAAHPNEKDWPGMLSYWKSASSHSHDYPLYSKPGWGRRSPDPMAHPIPLPSEHRADYSPPSNECNKSDWPGQSSYWESAADTGAADFLEPFPWLKDEPADAGLGGDYAKDWPGMPSYWLSAAHHSHNYPSPAMGLWSKRKAAPKPRGAPRREVYPGPPSREEAMRSWPGLPQYWLSASRVRQHYNPEDFEALDDLQLQD